MHWKDILIERAEAEYDRQIETERIERERAEEEAECARLLAADLAETGCTSEEIEDRICECGHLFTQHHAGFAYGLETFHCEECGCPEFSARRLPRIERRPVQLVRTAQGNLFQKEVA